MKEQIKKETIENATREIAKAELWIEFYESLIAKIKDPKESAQHKLKIEGITKSVDFNQSVIDFFSK